MRLSTRLYPGIKGKSVVSTREQWQREQPQRQDMRPGPSVSRILPKKRSGSTFRIMMNSAAFCRAEDLPWASHLLLESPQPW
ncbi:unnamed protein product [Boreogadus saida]